MQVEALADAGAADQRRPLAISGPSCWQPNHSVPAPSKSMWRIESWCSAGVERVLFHQRAGGAVDEDQRRLHRRDVELGAAEIRMRLDAAIGDGQRLAVRAKQQFVRADAMGRELADAAEPVRRVVDADHAGGIVEVVLGRIEQRAVRRKHAVAVEMPALDAGDRDRLCLAGMVEDHGKRARLTREHHRAARYRIEGDVVAAFRQVERMDKPARSVRIATP